jgi:hypothetical protein
MKEDRNKMLEAYKLGYNDLQNAMREFPMEMWDYKPAPDKWCIKEIIIHITDSEINAYLRCRKIIAENGSTITPYDQDAWAEKLMYTSRSVDTNLELFRLLRVVNYSLLVSLPSEMWGNCINHPETGKITLSDWLKIYSEHVPIHINQMRNNFVEWKKSQKY